jgi:hypothetical protein
MDTVIADVVSQTATKFSLDKRFLAGLAAGFIVSAGVVGVVKLKEKLAARANNVEDSSAE